jgi:hypothetical protein
MNPMAALRGWLRQLIDEPTDASLDALMRLRKEAGPSISPVRSAHR